MDCFPFSEEILSNWRNVKTELFSADKCVSKYPCFLFSISIASNGSGVADAEVYNGQNTNGVRLLGLRCADNDEKHRLFVPPVYFNRGLYLDIVDNVEAVTVQYLIDPRK